MQHNGTKNKRTHNDLQNTTQKTKYRVTRPPPPKKDKNKNQKIQHRQSRLKSGTAINQSDMIKHRNEIKLISDLCIYKITYYF
jgi:hypothetical protein